MKIAKYFSAVWCGPCKIFKPIMQELSAEGYNIQFIDVDNDHNLAQTYNIKSVPTVVIEKDGSEVQRIVGIRSKEQIKLALS